MIKIGEQLEEIECVIPDLLMKYRKKISKRGGAQNLSDYIKALTGHHIDKDKILKISERRVHDKNMPLSVADLKALYLLFEADDRKILEPLFKIKPHLLSMLENRESINVFIQYENTYKQKNVMDFNFISAFNEIQNIKKLNHLFINLVPVSSYISLPSSKSPLHQTLNKNDKWFQTLDENTPDTIISIGSPYESVSSEHVIAKILDQRPFKEKESLKLPLHLIYTPPITLRNLGSSIDLNPERFTNIYGEDNRKDRLRDLIDEGLLASYNYRFGYADLILKKYYPQFMDKIRHIHEKGTPDDCTGKIEINTYADYRSCFFVNKKPYILPLEKETERGSLYKSFGVFIARRFPVENKSGSKLLSCFFGLDKRDNIAIAKRLFSDKHKTTAILPRLKQNSPPHVLIMVFSTEYLNVASPDIEPAKVLTAQLWEKKNDEWLLIEDSNKSPHSNKFIGRFDD